MEPSGRRTFILGEYPGEALMLDTTAGQTGHLHAIASAALYLAADETEFVHGTVIDGDGDGGRAAFIVTKAARILLPEKGSSCRWRRQAVLRGLRTVI
jgi:hypothetical protein